MKEINASGIAIHYKNVPGDERPVLAFDLEQWGHPRAFVAMPYKRSGKQILFGPKTISVSEAMLFADWLWRRKFSVTPYVRRSPLQIALLPSARIAGLTLDGHLGAVMMAGGLVAGLLAMVAGMVDFKSGRTRLRRATGSRSPRSRDRKNHRPRRHRIPL